MRRRAPGRPLAVVSAAPEGLWRTILPESLTFRRLVCDVGLVQDGALCIDETGTLAACDAFALRWEGLVEREAGWLRRVDARIVLGDVPPLAFAAAARADVPSLALANFSWDWIYGHLARRQARLASHAASARQAYSQASGLLRLPFAGDLSAFAHSEDIPLIARCSTLSRREARDRLGIEAHRRIVLLSFGGLGLPGFDSSVLRPLAGYLFLVSSPPTRPTANVCCRDARGLAERGLDYIDMVRAADVVVTKPGYGIVTDAIGAGTRLVYTERGDFPEYPILVNEMPRYLACAHVDNARLLRGDLGPALEVVLQRAMPAPPDLSGADRAAQLLLERAGSG